MPPQKSTYFQEKWLSKPEFRGIIKRNFTDKTNTSALCFICDDHVIYLSNMGATAIRSHFQGKKHSERLRARKSSNDLTLYGSSGSKASAPNTSAPVDPDDPIVTNQTAEDKSEGTSCDNSSNKDRESLRGLEKYILRDEVSREEILWCLFVVENHLSLRTGGEAYKIFSKMFRGCEIADKMELGKTKLAYNIAHGLAPYFHDLLVKEVNEDCDNYVLAFDESLNKFCKQQQLDVAITFWSKSLNKVNTRYFNSAFLGHTTAADLLRALLGVLEPLDLKKLLELSMDGPNVNLKLIKDLEVYLTSVNDPDDPMFLFLGTCGLHTVHNAFKAGFCDKLTGRNVISFLRAIYNLFKDVPTRRSDFVKYTKCTLMPIKFCPIRWLTNAAVAERAKLLLPKLALFKEGIENDPQHKGIKTGSYDVVVNALADKLMPAKLAFFISVARDLEPFLTKFQTNNPMAPRLFTELIFMLQGFLEQIVKDKFMANQKVADIDLKNDKNFIDPKDFEFPSSVKSEIRKATLSKTEMFNFKLDCIKILREMCAKLLEKSPLKYDLCRGITFCDPSLLKENEKACFKRLELTLITLEQKHWFSATQCEAILKEFKHLCCKPEVKQSFKNFDLDRERLDVFWATLLELHKCSDLLKGLLKNVMILSHGNAFVERGVSVNKELITENQLNESLVAQRQVYDGIQNMGGVQNIDVENIPKAMILKVRNARSLYEESMQKKRNDKKAEGIQNVNKQRLIEEVQELKTKRLKLMTEKQKEIDRIEERLKYLCGDSIVI